MVRKGWRRIPAIMPVIVAAVLLGCGTAASSGQAHQALSVDARAPVTAQHKAPAPALPAARSGAAPRMVEPAASATAPSPGPIHLAPAPLVPNQGGLITCSPKRSLCPPG